MSRLMAPTNGLSKAVDALTQTGLARERQTFRLGAQHHRKRHPATGGRSEYRHLLWGVRLYDRLPHRHRVVHRSRIRKIRRHAVVDRDHLELAETCHQDRFARCGLGRSEDVAAAVHVNQQAIAILFGNIVGSEHIAIHARDRHLLRLHAELLTQARERLDDLVSTRLDQRLPCGGVLGMIIPERWKRCSNEGLVLRTDVRRRHCDFLGRDLASAGFESESRGRDGKAKPNNYEIQFEAYSHWSPPPA